MLYRGIPWVLYYVYPVIEQKEENNNKNRKDVTTIKLEIIFNVIIKLYEIKAILYVVYTA